MRQAGAIRVLWNHVDPHVSLSCLRPHWDTWICYRSNYSYSLCQKREGDEPAGQRGGANLIAGLVECLVGEAILEVLHEGHHEWVIGIQKENLLGGNDRFDVIQVHNNGVLATKDCGRVRQQRVQEAEVAGWKVCSPHDDMFPDL